MTRWGKARPWLALFLALSLFAPLLGFPVITADPDDTIYACVRVDRRDDDDDDRGNAGRIRIVGAATRCRKDEVKIQWNVRGLQGPAGAIERPGFALTTLDSAGWVGQRTSITIGADGLGLISYFDRTNLDLKVAHCSNTLCVPFHRRR